MLQYPKSNCRLTQALLNYGLLYVIAYELYKKRNELIRYLPKISSFHYFHYFSILNLICIKQIYLDYYYSFMKV